MLKQIEALGTFYPSLFLTNFAKIKEYGKAGVVSRAAIVPAVPSSQRNSVFADFSALGEYFNGDIWLTLLERKHDFGLVLEEQNLQIALFNSAHTNRELLGVYPLKNSGVTLSGVSAPYSFKPLEEINITFKIAPVGDLAIEAVYTFVFAGQTIIVTFFGERIAIFELQDVIFKRLPQMEYAEGETLQTDIFTAQNGKETRQPLVERAKRYVEYKIRPQTNADVIELQDAVTRAMRTFCYQPLWFSAAKIKENSVNTVTVKADTINRDFEVGGMVMLQRLDGLYMFASVHAMSDTTISFERIINAQDGWIIVPIIKMSPENSNSYSFNSSKISEWTLKLKELL